MSYLDSGVQTLGLLSDMQPKLKTLKRATDGFETLFVKNLLSEMRKGMKEVNLGGDKTGSDMYKDMMDQAIADKLSSKGSLGVGKILYKDFAPKVVAIERQQMIRAAHAGTLPEGKGWVLGKDEPAAKAASPSTMPGDLPPDQQTHHRNIVLGLPDPPGGELPPLPTHPEFIHHRPESN